MSPEIRSREGANGFVRWIERDGQRVNLPEFNIGTAPLYSPVTDKLIGEIGIFSPWMGKPRFLAFSRCDGLPVSGATTLPGDSGNAGFSGGEKPTLALSQIKADRPPPPPFYQAQKPASSPPKPGVKTVFFSAKTALKICTKNSQKARFSGSRHFS